jgi:hypothetical protein
MIQHFHYKQLFENQSLPGWRIHFFYERQKYEAIYHPDGNVEWQSQPPNNLENVSQQIHELMVYHVYDHRK